MQLSKRLNSVADGVITGQPLADIGTDHGYLPIYLVASGRCPRAIAIDVAEGPLAAARENIARAGLGDRIELRLGSGLMPLEPGEVATITMAGMGGNLMAQLLAEAPPHGARRLVLQPQGGEAALRRQLVHLGWQLTGEQIVYEGGHHYPILTAEPGEASYDEADLLLGPYLRRQGGPLFVGYVENLIERTELALAGARLSVEAAERQAELSARLQLLKEALQ